MNVTGRVWDICFDALRWRDAVERLDAELEALRATFDAVEHASHEDSPPAPSGEAGSSGQGDLVTGGARC